MPEPKQYVRPKTTAVEVPLKPGERGLAQKKEVPVVSNKHNVEVPPVLSSAEVAAIMAKKK